MRILAILLITMLAAPLALAAKGTQIGQPIQPNDNRVPGGKLRGAVLRIDLEAREGIWYPESKDGPGMTVQAFAERGKELLVPGPMIRVSEGARIRATIRNTLADKLVIHGFHTRPGDATDTAQIAPGDQREFDFEAGAAGTYYYWGSTMPGAPNGRPVYRDAVLSGAFIVDPKGAKVDPEERVFMIGIWRKDPALDDMKLPQPGAGQVRAFTINGLSWPFTERLDYKLGDAVRWRWINAAYEPHPMHLHGFYYDILSIGDGERDQHFAPEMRPHVFTSRMSPGGTMSLAWSPERSGNWLFHCHMIDHIGPHLRLRPPAAHTEGVHSMDHVRDGMAGLVLGITVKPKSKDAAKEESLKRRELKLFVQEEPGRFSPFPALGYALQAGDHEPAPNKVEIPGPLIVLTKDEPTSIAITNRANEETSVHWHGIELESYFDGVPGWGGDGHRVTPPIKPGETFVAEMTPPRAGTFIYHTHWHDDRQLASGMYGPLVVMEPGETYDTATERMVIFSDAPKAPNTRPPLLVNGTLTPTPLTMQVGVSYRVRLINITASHVNFFVRLAQGEQGIPWRAIAKDGADLPPNQTLTTAEVLSLSVGETRDFEYRPTSPGDLRVEIRNPDGRLRTSIGVLVR
jgi:manganese oxidase